MITTALKKTARLLHIQYLLMRRLEGYATGELARACGVHPRTIRRDLLDLQSEPLRLPLVKDAGHRWRFAETGRFGLPPVNLTLQQGAALYLAARLLRIVSDEPNCHVEQALEALARVLPTPMGEPILRLLARDKEGRDKEQDDLFSDIFSVLALGWGTGRKVALKYRTHRSGRFLDVVFSPYVMEPSPWGWGLYVIGHAEPPGAIRTYKLERIQSAQLTSEILELPGDFDLQTYLGQAWGVWRSDEQPVTVQLRFTPDAARRVRETRWHPTQTVVDLPDGGCTLTVQVAEPIEMTPWIRSWGSGCEVLHPPELRAGVLSEIRAMAAMYGHETP